MDFLFKSNNPNLEGGDKLGCFMFQGCVWYFWEILGELVGTRLEFFSVYL